MRTRVSIVAVALALMAAACGGGEEQVVATVNGQEISADFMASLGETAGDTLNVNTEEFRQLLTQNIIRIAVAQAAEESFGITVDEAAISERITNPPVRYTALFEQLDSQDATETMIQTQAELSILRDRVTEELINEEEGFIESVLAETPQQMTAGCVRHILVGTQLEAAGVIDRLNSGEDFEALANELSLDESSQGGFVSGCPAPFSTYVDNFAFAAATAPLNEIIGPVQTQFGFHVMKVEQRSGPPSAAEVREDPLLWLPSTVMSDFFTPWFNDVVRESDVTVADAVGRWSSVGLGIVPPGS